MASSRVPRYRQMLESVFDRMGWDAREFRGMRYTIAYPPIPTAAMLSFALPEA